MCLIIENKTEKKLLNLISKEKISQYMEMNPDGFGITAQHKNLIIKKGFGLNNFLQDLEEIESIKNIHYFIHFRKATVGKVSLENIHPFDILGNNHLYFMHNGTMPKYQNKINVLNQEESDTKEFITELQQILKAQKNILKYIHQKKFQNFIHQKIGNGRAVLMSSETNIIFNENLWIQMNNGLKYSKNIDAMIN